MKKVIILIIAISFSFTPMKGQEFPFPQDSASWTYWVTYWDAGESEGDIVTFTLYGDSIIKGNNTKL